MHDLIWKGHTNITLRVPIASDHFAIWVYLWDTRRFLAEDFSREFLHQTQKKPVGFRFSDWCGLQLWPFRYTECEVCSVSLIIENINSDRVVSRIQAVLATTEQLDEVFNNSAQFWNAYRDPTNGLYCDTLSLNDNIVCGPPSNTRSLEFYDCTFWTIQLYIVHPTKCNLFMFLTAIAVQVLVWGWLPTAYLLNLACWQRRKQRSDLSRQSIHCEKSGPRSGLVVSTFIGPPTGSSLLYFSLALDVFYSANHTCI